jgi:hypothetical protein
MYDIEKAFAREFLDRWLEKPSYWCKDEEALDMAMIYPIGRNFSMLIHDIDNNRPTAVEVSAAEVLKILYALEFATKNDSMNELCSDEPIRIGDRMKQHFNYAMNMLNKLTNKSFPLWDNVTTKIYNDFDNTAERFTTKPHTSDNLATLNQASSRFWSNADPVDNTTHPINSEVVAWLIQRGYSQTLAEKAAAILRPKWATVGRKADK